MMFIFGFVWGTVNLIVFWSYLTVASENQGYRKVGVNLSLWTFNLLVIVPIWIFMTIMPFFGGWIVTPIVKKVSRINLTDA